MAPEERIQTLYDFLFIDHARVRSLYAQLFSGLLNEIETLASESKTKTDELTAGGAPFASYAHKGESTAEQAKVERLDPHDLVLQDVLSKLHETRFIVDDPDRAVPGNIVLLNGTISILDFSLYQGMFGVFDHMFPERPPKKSNMAQKEQHQKQRQFFEVMKSYTEAVPLMTTVLVETPAFMAWGAINKQHLRDDPAALTLKHGSTLAGEWYILAIMDVLGTSKGIDRERLPQVITGLMDGTDGMKNGVGRPADFAGITPLLIFRKLQVPG